MKSQNERAMYRNERFQNLGGYEASGYKRKWKNQYGPANFGMIFWFNVKNQMFMTLDSTYGIQMPPLTAVNVLFMKRQHLATRALRVLPRAEAPHHVNEKHQSRTKLLDIWSSFISRYKKACKFYAYVWAIAILDSFSRTSMLSMHMPNLSWSKLWTNQFPMSVPFWGSLDLVWHQAHNKTNDKANPNTRSSHMWGYQHQNIMSTYTTVWNKGST